MAELAGRESSGTEGEVGDDHSQHEIDNVPDHGQKTKEGYSKMREMPVLVPVVSSLVQVRAKLTWQASTAMAAAKPKPESTLIKVGVGNSAASFST